MDNLEAICVEIKTERNEIFLIVVVYVPPNKVEQMTLLGKLVKEANKSYQNIIVTGDMNAKSTIWGNTEINGAGSILEGIVDEEFDSHEWYAANIQKFSQCDRFISCSGTYE